LIFEICNLAGNEATRLPGISGAGCFVSARQALGCHSATEDTAFCARVTTTSIDNPDAKE